MMLLLLGVGQSLGA